MVRARLFDLNRERDAIVEAVVDRVLSRYLEAAWESQEHGLEVLITEAAYSELNLLEGARSKRDRAEYSFWRDIALTASRSGEDANADLLVTIVQRYTNRIVGRCNPTIFRFVSKAAPATLNALFNARTLKGWGDSRQQWAQRIRVGGEVERIHRLSRLGTLVFTPTQTSHLDPLLLGWALDQSGLPPAAYGAGSDLFSQPIPALLMRSLGSYQFNARLKHNLYRAVLHTTTQVLLERGFHSMFFPAGYRSRDGRIESALKTELLRPILGAYVQGLIRHEPRRLFVVPVTISYHLVLEAETLIAHALRRDTDGRQAIARDEFNDLTRLTAYASRALSTENAVAITFCPPLDPFGNEVDERGDSLDQKRRPIDPARYVERDGIPCEDEVRDAVYVSNLAQRILESFHRNNVLFCVPLVSLTILEMIRARHPRWDERRTIQFGLGEFISREELVDAIQKVQRLAQEDGEQGKVLLGPCLAHGEPDQILDEAYHAFRSFHSTPLLRRRGNGFELTNTELLFFYSNRARGYGYERRMSRS